MVHYGKNGEIDFQEEFLPNDEKRDDETIRKYCPGFAVANIQLSQVCLCSTSMCYHDTYN